MIYSNPLLTGAAWLMALAMILLAGSVAYTTFYAEPGSWAEYEACRDAHEVTFTGAPEEIPEGWEEAAAAYIDDNCDPFRPVPREDTIPFDG